MGNLKFRDVITLRSLKVNKYLAAEKDGSTNVNRDDDLQWEKFLILNPDDLRSSSEIRSGDTIALLSYHNKYLVCEPNGEINANREQIGAWEKFTIYHFNDDTDTSLFHLQNIGKWTPISLKAHTGKFLTVNTNFKTEATRNSIDTSPLGYSNNEHQTAFFVYVQNWTDFHYGVPIGDPECSSRGRFDGANCFIAKPPSGNPFIYQNNFYYTSNNPNPVLGWHDGANAQVGQNDSDDHPFVHDNKFYLQSNPILSGSSSSDFGEVIATGHSSSLKVCVYPKRKQYNSLNQLIGQTDININQIEYFKVCYKKKWSAANVCKQSIYWSGTNCGIIGGLKVGKSIN